MVENRLARCSYFGGHDETGGRWIQCDITGHQTHIFEFFVQLPVLLVAQSFDRRCIDHTLLVPQCHGDGIPIREDDNESPTNTLCCCVTRTQPRPSFRLTYVPRRARIGCSASR